MKSKKALIAIIIISFSLLFSLFYFNYFSKSLFIKDFKEEEKVEVFSKYNLKKEIVCYGNSMKCTKVKYDVKGKVNTKKLGTYEITYTADYRKNKLVMKKKVKVVDTTKPVLTVEGSFANVCKNGKNSDIKLKAEDNYDGDLTDKIEYKLEETKLTYKVKDSSGNVTKKSFDVIINDNENPNLILNGNATLYLRIGSTYKESGFSAIDNCDGDLTESVKTEGSVDTSKQGTYEIKYSVTDESGNMSTVKRIIKVFPKNDYSIGSVSGKVIYLTFDDGPGAYTSRLLDILSTYNVKATFFVTNSGDDALIKREFDEGHTVGLHTASHKYDQIYASEEAYMEDLLSVQNRVKRITGVESKIIRFPGGSSNTISRRYRVGIMSTLTNKVEELGFRYFDWTISSGDAGNTTDSNVIVRNVTNSVGENKLNIVLMHDIKSYTVNAIEGIIQYGLSNGYTFAPITMDSPTCHQKVNN